MSTQVVRQDRISFTDVRSFVELGPVKLELANVSTFGLAAFLTESTTTSLTIGTVFKEARIVVSDTLLAEVDLKLVREETGPKGVYLGFEVMGRSLPLKRIVAFPQLLASRDRIADQRQIELKHIPSEFRLTTLELKRHLELTKKEISAIEQGFEFSSFMERAEFESGVLDIIGSAIYGNIQTAVDRMTGILSEVTREDATMCLQYFREQLSGLIFLSAFTDRSYRKPRGYAGDYEMMSIIYRNENFGPNLFARCMERAVQQFPEPTAVRSRAVYLESLISSHLTSNTGATKILSLACGPAFELRKVIQNTTAERIQNVEFWLVDQDEEALKAAQRNIETAQREAGKQVNYVLLHKGIKDVIAGELDAKQFNLIYSAGLFDYLTDPVAFRVAQMLHQTLLPGGELVIGNFDTSAPNKIGMLALFDWDLIYRSNEDMRRLFSRLSTKISAEAEQTKINIFCRIGK